MNVNDIFVRIEILMADLMDQAMQGNMQSEQHYDKVTMLHASLGQIAAQIILKRFAISANTKEIADYANNLSADILFTMVNEEYTEDIPGVISNVVEFPHKN